MSPLASSTPADLKSYRDAGVDELYLTPVFHKPMTSEAQVVTYSRACAGLDRAGLEALSRMNG